MGRIQAALLGALQLLQGIVTLKDSTDSPTGKWNKLMLYILWTLFLGSVGWILWSFYEQIREVL
jgi:hypothetical protein